MKRLFVIASLLVPLATLNAAYAADWQAFQRDGEISRNRKP
jgi:hypothetical protein